MEFLYFIVIFFLLYLLYKNIFPSSKDRTDSKTLADITNMSDKEIEKEKSDLLMWYMRTNKANKLAPLPKDLIIRYKKKQLYDAMLDMELINRNFSGTLDEKSIQKTRTSAAQIMFDKLRKRLESDEDLSMAEIINSTIDQADNYASSIGDKKTVLESWLYDAMEAQLNKMG